MRYSVGAKLAGVIYVHRISDVRFGGAAAKNFREFRELYGEKTLKNVTLMTNMRREVTLQEGATREQQLREEYLKAGIKKGARIERRTNTPESVRAILREILKNRPAVLKIQRELIDESKDIGETGAGAELNREIREFAGKHQKEMRELEENMRRAMEDKDEESWEELEEGRRKMEKLQKDSAEMQHKFEQARREMEERMDSRFEAQMLRIHAAYEAELWKYEERVKELERDGRENTSQIASLRKTMEDLRKKAATDAKKCTIM